VILECPARSTASRTCTGAVAHSLSQITKITNATCETASPADSESRLIEPPPIAPPNT
jgi:hypothetical protein